MGRKSLIEERDRTAILAAENTAEFAQQFAPISPRRAAEFEAKLASLIESHCAAREVAVLREARNMTARRLGALGGEKGGPRRAQSLSREQRVDLAVKAARARWHGERDRQHEAATVIQAFRTKRGRLPSRRALAKHLKCSLSSAARYLKKADAELSFQGQ